MRTVIMAAALAGGACGASGADLTLVAIDIARPGEAYELLARGVPIVEARPSFALALTSPEKLDALDGYRYADLGVPSGPVYLAWPRAGENLPDVPGVAVMAEYGGAFVVSGEPAAVEKLAWRGAELKRLGAEPLKPPREAELRTISYDPLVAELVSRVRADRYFGHVENLAAVKTRYSHASEIETATRYIENYFGSLGYDTARRSFVYEPMDNDYLFDCIFRADGRLGWLTSVWGYVWRSDDYGRTWTAYKSRGRLSEGKFVTHRKGFVVGGRNFIGRTNDGGLTWTQLTLEDPDDDLRDIDFYGTDLGIAAGLDGVLYRTDDGGTTWRKVATPMTLDIFGVRAQSRDQWWALGEWGWVMRSYDGGLTWTKFDLPQTKNYTMRRIAFPDASHATMVGYDGTILYSEDAGETWRRVSGSPSEWPYFTDVAYADASRGWAVGSDGRIYRTDDGGLNWTRQRTPLKKACCFESVSVVSREEVWAAGYPSALVHTTDGGARWEAVNITNQEPIVWYNVEATKPGVTRPNETYVLCGHYDSISDDPWVLAPGAEDNASGTAGVLEAAAAMADYRFDATFKFVAFAGEEEGLIGSRAYVREEYERNADIRAAFNMDMISYLDEPGHDVEVRYNAFSEELLARYREAAQLYVPGYTVYPVTKGHGGSDHESFWDYGYPALLSIEYAGKEFYPRYHSTTDLPKFLTPAFGADVTRANVAAAASLAGLREGPSRSSDRVLAYPNPAKPSAGHRHIRFANLSPGSSFALYDLAGEKLYEVSPVSDRGYVEWPLTTSGGEAAASGVYLFAVEDVGGERFSGKVAVIR